MHQLKCKPLALFPVRFLRGRENSLVPICNRPSPVYITKYYTNRVYLEIHPMNTYFRQSSAGAVVVVGSADMEVPARGLHSKGPVLIRVSLEMLALIVA